MVFSHPVLAGYQKFEGYGCQKIAEAAALFGTLDLRKSVNVLAGHLHVDVELLDKCLSERLELPV